MNCDAILDVRDLKTSFNVKRSGRIRVQAVDGVSLSWPKARCLGLSANRIAEADGGPFHRPAGSARQWRHQF